jgi:membrane-bound lytic murein transglycosylase B
MRLSKILLLSALALPFAPGIAKADPSSLTKPPIEYKIRNKALASLADSLKTRGFDIDTLLADSRFKIYHGIENYFKKSKAAAERYQEASEQEKERLYQNYKKNLDFEWKAKEMPDFYRENLPQLKKAEAQSKVIPSRIIAAILGTESNYGNYNGKYNPFNVCVSLHLAGYKTRNYNPSVQLTEYLKFRKGKGEDIFADSSSCAAAIGPAQFLPSSINSFFIGDDVYDMNSCILSIGNYLAHFKKETGSLEKAILAYNPSSFYLRFVLELAEVARKVEFPWRFSHHQELQNLERNRIKTN